MFVSLCVALCPISPMLSRLSAIPVKMFRLKAGGLIFVSLCVAIIIVRDYVVKFRWTSI